MTTPEIIDQIHDLILEDRRISPKSITEKLGISRERVGSIIHEDLDMRKLSAKWVPKCLTRIKDVNGASRLGNFGFFQRDANDFLSRLVNTGETWLYHYDPQTKQQSMEWWHSDSPRPKKIPSAKIPWKRFRFNFFGGDQDGVLLIDYLPKGQTISAEYYSSPLVQLKDILKEKLRGKVTKGVLFLHGNAPIHRALATQTKLAYLCFQCLDHPPHCPDLVPSDYHLFPELKNN